MKRKTWMITGACAIVVAGGAYWAFSGSNDEVKWRTANLDRGNITQRISATGTVSAMVQVAVGTQVSGVVSALYVDYNSLVKKGQLIAEIDPTLALTTLKDAEATLQRAKDTCENAAVQYRRAKRLHDQQLLADQDLDTQDIALKTAKTNVDNAKAALERAKANLGYCRITAPVDGVVVSRLADVGQTVAASFSTPNLFQIAQDLSKMKVQASIDESDIDQVQVGQRVFFTVDSLPDRQFAGSVSRVRLDPTTTSNVVTYTVEMEVTNEPLNRAAADQVSKDRGAGGESAERPRDPEKAWEHMKDRLPAGTTKEEFLRRFKERMAERAKAEAPAPAPAPQKTLSQAQRIALAHTPGGLNQFSGPVFSGELALRPGMTANVTIQTNQHRDVLRVPNAALRFNPKAFLKDKDDSAKKSDASKNGGNGQRAGGGSGNANKGGMATKREDRVWILDEHGKPKPIPVKAGITDGQFTEVSGDLLQEGMKILVGTEDAKKAAASGTSPILGGGPGMPPRR